MASVRSAAALAAVLSLAFLDAASASAFPTSSRAFAVRGGATKRSPDPASEVDVVDDASDDAAAAATAAAPTVAGGSQIVRIEPHSDCAEGAVAVSAADREQWGWEAGSTVLVRGRGGAASLASVVEGSSTLPAGALGMPAASCQRLRLGRAGGGATVRRVHPKAAGRLVLTPLADTVDGYADDLFDSFIAPYFSDEKRAVHVGDVLKLADADGVVADFKVVEIELDGGAVAPFALVTAATDIDSEGEPLDRSEAEDKEEDVVGYADIGGSEKVLGLVREMVELPLRHPEVFKAVGIPPPRGVLLQGPSGSGKTMMARAIATETGAYFKVLNGPEIMSRSAGSSESNLRDAFMDAEKNAPAIIFIDEIDSIAGKRDGSGGEAEKRVVSQLLTLMDSVNPLAHVCILAATNRPGVLDPALRRFGRFDKELDLGVPNEEGRAQILKIKTQHMKLDKDVNLDEIAEDGHGYVGADMGQLCTEAALRAVRRAIVSEAVDIDQDELDDEALEAVAITMADFRSALRVCTPSSIRENHVEIPDIAWDDVGGLEDVKAELRETVEYPVKFAKKFDKFGMKPSRGVLFYGPPGCGKTLMAKAVASQCGANFLSVKGPELLTMWFGESEANVRNLFDKARAAAPCILFFDEMDSIARARSSGGAGGGEASDRVMNQILAEIDVASQKNVFVIGATNRPDILDPAVTRPGRLDRLVHIPLPDLESRKSILKANTRKSPLDPDVDFEAIGDATEGFSGADLTEICQTAAKTAIRQSVLAKIAHNARVDSGELPEDAEWVDPVPRITALHFRDAMSGARRSVPQAEIDRFNAFEKAMKVNTATGGKKFSFDGDKKEGGEE